nr:MAG TPA: hypothetical protein [Caudoviricetes sp.]
MLMRFLVRLLLMPRLMLMGLSLVIVVLPRVLKLLRARLMLRRFPRLLLPQRVKLLLMLRLRRPLKLAPRLKLSSAKRVIPTL